MIWTAWNNGRHHTSGAGYGFKIAAADRNRYFRPNWDTVTVELSQGRGAVATEVNVAKKSFWGEQCREVIGQEIGRWLRDSGYAPWPHGSPPQFEVEPAQAELDKAIHVHRVEFETEFRVLADIWAKLAVLRSAMGALRPMADIVDPDEDPDVRLKRRLGAFEAALHDSMRAVDDQSPFYPEDILRELSEALTIANRESISVSLGKPEKSSDWFKEGVANFSAFEKSAEAVSSLIRQRLESLRMQR